MTTEQITFTDALKNKVLRYAESYLSVGVDKAEAIEATLTGALPGSKSVLWDEARSFLNENLGTKTVTLIATGKNKTKKIVRGVADDQVDMESEKLYDLGYTRVSVKRVSVAKAIKAKKARKPRTPMYRTDSIESLLG